MFHIAAHYAATISGIILVTLSKNGRIHQPDKQNQAQTNIWNQHHNVVCVYMRVPNVQTNVHEITAMRLWRLIWRQKTLEEGFLLEIRKHYNNLLCTFFGW